MLNVSDETNTPDLRQWRFYDSPSALKMLMRAVESTGMLWYRMPRTQFCGDHFKYTQNKCLHSAQQSAV